MAGNIKFKIEGIEDAKKMLKSLPQAVNDRVMYDINKAGAKIVQKDLQQAAAGNAGDNDKASKNKMENNVIIAKGGGKTGVLIGFAKRAFHVLFVEFGTKVRKNESGANRGTMSRKPFVVKTHDEAAPKVVEYLQQNTLKIINRTLKRFVKKYRNS